MFPRTLLLLAAAGSLLAQQAPKPEEPPLDAATESPIFDTPIAAPRPPVRVPPTDSLMRAPSNNGGAGDPGASNPVIQLEIDELTPAVIPTSSIRTTTIMFPFAIDDVQGAGFTPDPSKLEGDYLISVRSRYISLTAQKDGVRRNLNVIAGGRNYPLDVIPANPPSDAAFSVILRTRPKAVAPIVAGAPGAPAGEPPIDASPIEARRSTARPKSPLKSAGGARILGVLDQIKLLSGQGSIEDAKKAASLMDGVSFAARSDVTDHLDYRIEVTHVLRNTKLDALGFAVKVKNTCARALRFDPESFATRVGDPSRGLLLRQVTSDINPVLAPGEERRAYFVVIGTAEGTPNWVDPANRFTVSLDLVAEGGAVAKAAASPTPTRSRTAKR